jgi:UDP-N-acetylmuramate: L-alanyl-gamma-D-glutamyl-meso-diaminopimelate ligase
MAGLAIIAKQQGYEVCGSDQNVYPPMSDQLAAAGIELFSGFSAENLINSQPDLVVIGNVGKRGNPEIEYVLNNKLPFTSGPQWLAQYVLQTKHVLAVAGTHGKTTTASMLAWVLERAGKSPGFLIGGVMENFSCSARVTDSDYFVIEADEYDSAFFDKRSKFIHYLPHTLILNNLEFDHADIFADLAAIKKQFHHLVRTIPSEGSIIHNAADKNIQDVLAMGCWTPQIAFNATDAWHYELLKPDASELAIYNGEEKLGELHWPLLGEHNASNALAVIAAAKQIGVEPKQAMAALSEFKNVKRRMEYKGEIHGITCYDDFAHHPSAIKTTLNGLRKKVPNKRLIAVVELGSFTMRTGCHDWLVFADALQTADEVFFKLPERMEFTSTDIQAFKQIVKSFVELPNLVAAVKASAQAGDVLLLMSNTGFNSRFFESLSV